MIDGVSYYVAYYAVEMYKFIKKNNYNAGNCHIIKELIGLFITDLLLLRFIPR